MATTAPPTTAPPTTLPPTTLPPTSLPPTTLAPTTLAPTTPPPLDIEAGPIEVFVTLNAYLTKWPPAAINPALDQYQDFGPIEVTLSVEGEKGWTGIVASSEEEAIDVVVTIGGSIVVGVVIGLGPIVVTVSLPEAIEVLLDFEECNWVKWSKIGELDFTIDESNLAGKRPLGWKGCVYHIGKIRNMVAVYGANGVSLMKASGVHWGMDTIHPVGLKNKGAFCGDEDQHFFVTKLSELWMVEEKGLVRLDFSEFLISMGTVIMSLDAVRRLVYICDGTTGYVYSINDQSLGKGPVNITGLGDQDNSLYVASQGGIVIPNFEICTDIYDLGSRKPKTIRCVEVGTNVSEFLQLSVDYRTTYREDFRRIGWFTVNPDGRTYPKCYGVEFRFRLRTLLYEYLELDYLKVIGNIHGYSYLDTEGEHYYRR